MLLDHDITLGDDPGLAKDGVEAELQELIAARVRLRDDFRIVRREYPTDIEPVDLLCRDGEGRAVVIEVKRIGEIAGVEQLLRYQEAARSGRDARPDERAVRRHAHQAPGACSPRAAASSASRSTSSACRRAARPPPVLTGWLFEAGALLEEGGESLLGVGRLARPGHHVEGVSYAASWSKPICVERLLAEPLRRPASPGRGEAGSRWLRRAGRRGRRG